MHPYTVGQWLYANLSVQNILATIGVLFLLGNLKALPGAWHIRVIKGILTQLHLTPCPSKSTPHITISNVSKRPYLFAYLKTTTTTIPLECDYNLHKSNSTFFTDLDVHRTQLLANVFRRVLSASFIDKSRRKTQLYSALGGSCCMYKREIAPFQKYGMWSRVLGWDGKWIYLVSFFVRESADEGGGGFPKEEDIYASCIARYVFKDGRKTVSPIDVLHETGLIPSDEEKDDKKEDGKWSWKQFQEERDRGMEMAGLLAGLERLPSRFDPAEAGVL
ncbi:hypothetical protein MW887_008895 [Aspergillus wentii]|nr:hypothetical protein MW887_008895 [Aspergillus wentii]